MSKKIDFGVARVLDDPEVQWNALRQMGPERIRTAFRHLDVDWRKYNTNDYLFTHCTAVYSVATEDNGYWIQKPCEELVNANGNAWTTPVLMGSFRTFIGGENYLEHCFAEGTPVLMVDGSWKPIEQVSAGDSVVNRHGEPDRVVNLQIRKSGNLYEIGGDACVSGCTVVTGNHPMLTVYAGQVEEDARWRSVEKLNPSVHRIVTIDRHGRRGLKEFTVRKLESGELEVFNIEVENDHSYVADGMVAHNCQIPALSKGKLLDAILRPVRHHSEKYHADADVMYCDVLVATDRRHVGLIEKIESGVMNGLSMGTQVQMTQCSICGKVIGDNDRNCSHLERDLGRMVKCSDGKERIAAELCGACDENGDYIDGSNVFIELSWVQHPAGKGCVVNGFVETDEERELRTRSREELKSLFEGNLFERMRVADRGGNVELAIARAMAREELMAARIAGDGHFRR